MKTSPWTLTGNIKFSRGFCGWPLWRVEEKREITQRQYNGGHQPSVVTTKTRWRLASSDDLKAVPLAVTTRLQQLERACTEARTVLDQVTDEAPSVKKARDNLQAAIAGHPLPHNDVLPYLPIFRPAKAAWSPISPEQHLIDELNRALWLTIVLLGGSVTLPRPNNPIRDLYKITVFDDRLAGVQKLVATLRAQGPSS
jgi:hypothetical protein